MGAHGSAQALSFPLPGSLCVCDLGQAHWTLQPGSGGVQQEGLWKVYKGDPPTHIHTIREAARSPTSGQAAPIKSALPAVLFKPREAGSHGPEASTFVQLLFLASLAGHCGRPSVSGHPLGGPMALLAGQAAWAELVSPEVGSRVGAGRPQSPSA